MRRWLRIIQPDLFMLDTGMNDRGSALSNGNVYADKVPNAVVFAKNLETVLDRVPQSVKGMLIIPNEPNDVATTGIGYYPDIIKAAATQRGWAWHDDRAVLGNYPLPMLTAICTMASTRTLRVTASAPWPTRREFRQLSLRLPLDDRRERAGQSRIDGASFVHRYRR